MAIEAVSLVSIVVPGIKSEEKAPYVGTYAVEAHIKGMYAHVKTEFSLVNPNDRVMEGELEFPLPDGGVICGYAIDIKGVMTPASVVEKEKARMAFEAEVKQGIDPGLVEQIQGNAYRTRIYPLPKAGTRQIRVEYIAPLVLSPQGDAAYALPMPKTHLVKRDVKISVEMDNAPRPNLSGLGDKRFEMAQAVWCVESHETDVDGGEDLLISVPALSDCVTCVEKWNNDLYWSVSVRVGETSSFVGDLASITNWRIVWDASGSRTADDIQKARAVLEKLPDKANYELHVFRNKLEPALSFSTRQDLLASLDSVKYDGGTCFNALKPLAETLFDGMTCLFTDGMDTFDGSTSSFGARSVAMVSGKSRDVAFLRRLCGGRVIQLSHVTPDEAIRHALTPQPTISAVHATGVSDVMGIGLASMGRSTIVGRMQNNVTTAKIECSDGRVIDVTLSPENARVSNVIASAWAALRVDELSPLADDHRDELLAIGRYFSIVSPVSTMIVFERLDQWIKYDIEPPVELKELHEQWLNQRTSEADKKRIEEDAARSWKQRIEREWNSRVEWWNDPVPKKAFQRSGVFDDASDEPHSVLGRAVSSVVNGVREMASHFSTRQNSARTAGGAPRVSFSVEEDAFDPSPMPMAAPCAQTCERVSVEDDCCAVDENGGPSQSERNNAVTEASAVVNIKAWDPDTPYLKAIKDAGLIFKDSKSQYAEYLKQKCEFAESPAFYLDCAGLFFEEKETDLAVRILSNLVEIKLNDEAMLRVYAWRLREAGQLDEALIILRKVAKMRPDEAVSWRDLALTLELRARRDHSACDATEALELFKKAAFSPWERSDAMWTSLVALEEFNILASWCEKEKWPDTAPVIPKIDAKFRKCLDTDLRIVMMWDADNTDIDLHVLEPSGEEVFYSHKLSQSGGMISFDVTTGYGPEEFLHKKAPNGTYKIMANYYASHQQKVVGPATVTVTIFTHWGRADQTSQTMSLRLEKAKDKVAIGSIVVGN